MYNVYAMRAPTVTTCPGPIFAFPSQLHPRVPATGGVGGSGHHPPLKSRNHDRGRFETPRQKELREQRRREDEEIAVLLALGVL